MRSCVEQLGFEWAVFAEPSFMPQPDDRYAQISPLRSPNHASCKISRDIQYIGVSETVIRRSALLGAVSRRIAN